MGVRCFEHGPKPQRFHETLETTKPTPLNSYKSHISFVKLVPLIHSWRCDNRTLVDEKCVINAHKLLTFNDIFLIYTL